MRSLRATLFAALLTALASSQDVPLLYLPFDGSCEPVTFGKAVQLSAVGEIAFEKGLLGEAVRLVADCRYDVGGAFPVTAGTFAAWIRPSWPGSDATGRTLMCIYGPPDQPEPWRRNRWSVTVGGGNIYFNIYPQEGGQPIGISIS
ncbi:MAG: hypothetical protein ACUVX8_15545, partial [Candidatus Zipacnadales bacterium]